MCAAAIAWFVLLPRTRGDLFRVDEVHKISEMFALRLLLDGRAGDFPKLIDRSNGPVGKYLFGVAALIAGKELPSQPLLARLPPSAVTEPFVAEVHARPYLPLLAPCRHVSLLATALTIGLIAFAGARTHGLLAALIASAFAAMHWLTPTFGADAIFDPLMAFLIFATLPLVLFPRRAMLLAPFVGVLSAMAFQTRLNGGLALAASLAVLLVVQKNWKAAAMVTIAFAIGTYALNPNYWPDPIGGFADEVSYLRSTLAAVRPDGVRLPLWAAETSTRTPVAWTAWQKLRFTWIALGGLLLAGSALGVWFARRQRDVLAWSAVVIVGTLVWLPMPWARYFLVVLPPLALLAGIGYAGVFTAVFDAWRWRMRQPSA